jgi:putative phage-type endonuclease
LRLLTVIRRFNGGFLLLVKNNFVYLPLKHTNMNLIKEMEQRSEEWHEIRKGSIGGTRAKMLMAKNNLPLCDELIAERHSDYVEETFVNDAMQRGIDLEPVAIAEFTSATGYDVEHFGLVTNEKYHKCHLSPDGLILDGAGVPMAGVEVKCPSTKKHVEYIRSNKLPAEYKYQVYHYFTLVDTVETMYFVSFDPRFHPKPLHILEVTKEEIQEDLQAYQENLTKFIEKVNKYESQITDNF